MMICTRVLMLTGLLLFGLASGLPGQSTSPQALGLNLALRAGEASKLVLINGAEITSVQKFTSAAGRTHLKFILQAGGETHQAIVFDGTWKAADDQVLRSGTASLVGIWETFSGQPSFTVKKVSPNPLVSKTDAPAGAAVVRIDGAQINSASIQKFTSTAQKIHVTFTFNAGGKTYQGVVYAGTWSTATLETLRSGKVTLYGTWSTFNGKPSFVTRRVER